MKNYASPVVYGLIIGGVAVAAFFLGMWAGAENILSILGI